MTAPVADAFPELTTFEAAALERALLRASGRAAGGAFATIERRPLDGTWYRTEVVAGRLVTGENVRCFVKDFGTYRAEKRRMPERRAREIAFYRDLFADGDLGLARYGGVVERSAGTWLVLEHVDAVPLAWCEVDVWQAAAAWLGRFHAELASRPAPPPEETFEPRGPEQFASALARARAEAARYDGVVRDRLDAAALLYPDAVEALVAQPQTLVHGAFRPGQVLVDVHSDPPRICPVDWEIARTGSCLYDLATLTDGFGPDERQRFLAAYLEEAPWTGVTPDDLSAASTACRMHRTMKWIAHAHDRGIPPGDVRALAESLPLPDGART